MRDSLVRMAFGLALCGAGVGAASAETELKNDTFMSPQLASFQLGFAAGEIGGVRLSAAAAGQQVLKVRLLFGGGGMAQTITLHIYDDTAMTVPPGAQIFEGDFQLTPANDAFQDLDVSGDSVVVPQHFRIGIEFHHDGVPSIARDTDGNIAAARNFIFGDAGDGPKWHLSNFYGLTGDWIIRAIVADGGGSPDAGVTVDASTGSPDASTGGPDAGTGGQCNGNGDCEVGEYCDTAAHACTFDCRHDTDCPGDDQCNSLGQCVGATGDGGGGCCSTSERDGASGGAALGALGLAGLVGLAVTRRRRRADGARAA